MIKRVALLTSGGDAPGMNAAIRAVVRTGIYHKLEIVGFKRGYAGLIAGDSLEMELGSVADIIHRGGTILQTGRSQEFTTSAGRKKAVGIIQEQEIDALIALGGDGTLRGACELNKLGVPVIGIPGTIDNDIAGTDRTIGFDTVVNTVLDAVNKIRDTATSHERIFVIEVMGRNSGAIALAAGLAGGAESILIPEIPLNLMGIVDNIKRGMKRGKRHSIIILAEGAGHGMEITRQIGELTGLETRLSILGYIQRGGTPSAQDRILASRMGALAVKMLLDGKQNMMVAVRADELIGLELQQIQTLKKTINYQDYELAGILSI